MTPQPHVPALAIAGVAALVAWRLYARVRRLVSRQRLSRVRPWISVCLFPLLVVALLAGTRLHPGRALAELVGVAVGIGLGIYGLRRTRFEAGPGGLFYTPSAHIGIALSLLVAVRLVYRMVRIYASSDGFNAPPTAMVSSPLTLLVVGTLAGYYATYAFGLLRWRRRVEASAAGTPVEARTGSDPA